MASIRDRCPTCGFDPATVPPADAAVAARSFPRRYRAVLVRPEEEADLVRRRPWEGWSALEHAGFAAASMRAAADVVRRHGTGSLDVGTPDPDLTVDDVLARLEAASEELARAVEHDLADDLTALDAAREGVHVGTHHLRAAERVVDEVRGRL